MRIGPAFLSGIGFLALLAVRAESQCVAPAAPQIVAPPAEVSVGQTYAIAWTDTAADDGWYFVERSTSRTFDGRIEAQRISQASASFASRSTGIHYHRVRAVASCDELRVSAPSAPAEVRVVAERPNVVFTIHPRATFIPIGDPVISARSFFVVENITREPVAVAFDPVDAGTPAFFSVTHPGGGAAGVVTLPPRTPQRFDLTFNVNTTTSGAFQGLLAVRGISAPLAVAPFAFVALKVGTSGSTVQPRLRSQDGSRDTASFNGLPEGTPDTGRPAMSVFVSNDGTEPLHVVADIGPELWVMPEAGWNRDPIAPGQQRAIPLRTSRLRAPAGSRLPRTTYLTVRTSAGRAATMRIEDNDAPQQVVGTPPPPDPRERSHILPLVTRVRSTVGLFRTRLRVANVGATAVDALVILVPIGFNEAPRRTTVTIPAAGGLAFDDSLFQLFGMTSGAGSLEIRVPGSGAITVGASVYLTESVTAFAPALALPVFQRHEGAKQGVSHALPGISFNALTRMNVIWIETSRVQPAVGTVRMFDAAGRLLGQTQFALGAGELRTLPAQSLFNLQELSDGWIEISSQGGTIAGFLYAVDNLTGAMTPVGVTVPLGRPPTGALRTAATASKAYAVLGAVQTPAAGSAPPQSTSLTISTVSDAVETFLSYSSATHPSNVRVRIPLAAGQTLEIPDVLRDVFGIAPGVFSEGTVNIEAAADVQIVGRLFAEIAGQRSVTGLLPVLTSASEALASARVGLQRPLYFEGLEQSLDETTGTSWDLSLTELGDGPATVTVRLYESGNRTSPIAESDVSLARRQQVSLSTVFSELGLDQDERKKNRTNVQVVVIPKSGSGSVAALAIGFDQQTGSSVRYLLTPSGGIPASGASKVTATPPPAPPPARRRAVSP